MIEKTHLIKAKFIKRLNRFVAEVILNNKKILVHVPNTGRMGELLIPGVDVLLKEANGKYAFRMMYAYYKNNPILIDSILTNTIFQNLFENKEVPGYENCKIHKREPSYENHRFDFLIEDSNKKEEFIELKSCTLAYEDVAAFPDAVSDRASKHLKALAKSKKGTVIFFLFHKNISTFIPNFHTDFLFYETLKEVQNNISIKAFSVESSQNLNITGLTPVSIHIPEVQPNGFIILIIKEEAKNYKIHLFTDPENNNIFKSASRIKNKKNIILKDKSYKIIHMLPIITHTIDGDKLYFHNEILKNPLFLDESYYVYNFKSNPLFSSLFWDTILHIRYNKFINLI
jgi:sugar fermentation stimulation protein A